MWKLIGLMKDRVGDLPERRTIKFFCEDDFCEEVLGGCCIVMLPCFLLGAMVATAICWWVWG